MALCFPWGLTVLPSVSRRSGELSTLGLKLTVDGERASNSRGGKTWRHSSAGRLGARGRRRMVTSSTLVASATSACVPSMRQRGTDSEVPERLHELASTGTDDREGERRGRSRRQRSPAPLLVRHIIRGQLAAAACSEAGNRSPRGMSGTGHAILCLLPSLCSFRDRG